MVGWEIGLTAFVMTFAIIIGVVRLGLSSMHATQAAQDLALRRLEERVVEPERQHQLNALLAATPREWVAEGERRAMEQWAEEHAWRLVYVPGGKFPTYQLERDD